MKASKINIYKCSITPQLNAKIDSINSFLATPQYSELVYGYGATDLRSTYQKVKLDMEFVLPVPEEKSNGIEFGNYLQLVQDERTYYFFILRHEWTSQKSCRFICHMDTLNTYPDLEWSEKTTVMREHRDRFAKIGDVENANFQSETHRWMAGQPTFIKTYNISIPAAAHTDAKIIKASGYIKLLEGNCKLTNVSVHNFNPMNGLVIVKAEYNSNGADVGSTARWNLYLDVKWERQRTANRVIDDVPESLNPVLGGRDNQNITDNKVNENWYLIYNSDNKSGGTIRTYLTKDTDFIGMIPTTSSDTISLQAEDLESGIYYYTEASRDQLTWEKSTFWNDTGHFIYPEDMISGINRLMYMLTIQTTDGRIVSGSLPENDEEHQGAIFWRDGNNIKTTYCLGEINRYPKDQLTISFFPHYSESLPSITLKSRVAMKIHKLSRSPNTFIATDPNGNEYTDFEQFYKYAISTPLAAFPQSEKQSQSFSGIGGLDRTKSTLVKVVKLPYCPLGYKIDSNGNLNFDLYVNNGQTAEILGGNFIEVLNDVNFNQIIETNVKNPLSPAKEEIELDLKVEGKRDNKNESKIYNSEFYQPKFVYDNFSFLFELEKLDKKGKISPNLQLGFTPSRMFNSQFMFKFPEYITENKDTQDYNNVLIVNRNNELPIFNSEYMNYIRNGYNYDVKAKNKEDIGNRLATTFQLAGTAASILAAPVTGGLSLTAGVGLATSTASSIVRTVQSAAQNERDIQQKLNDKAAQSISVQNADSIDLLEAYSGNRAKIKTYIPTDRMREKLFDLFYYAGYKTDLQKIPNTNNRYWFNFVQCDPVFKVRNMKIYNDVLDDIKAKYRDGVTIYHRHDDESAPYRYYDFDQELENWETSLI